MNKITVYTTTQCPYCVMLKNFLVEQNVAFKEVNMEKDPAAMRYVVQTTGQMGVPQTDVNGTWIMGYDPSRLMKALEN
ncbi:glutaredoxin family protein [Bacillaceae bacterium SIJ1]|uniref:glutaredoxin family protein n=1 Tax=Litoribacterium kuwaitense TaxID=1398745 RepID=UPI0013EC4A5A|nr:glutaredoxin domain-containing protein [Litoribacterium kuwaitense]NGP43790.1 glutaredoxin family protein [Litoribacterium kuwaitense]